MSQLLRLLAIGVFLLTGQHVFAQTIVKGKIIDATTKEPVQGASIHCTKEGASCGCTTNANGEFEMKCQDCEQMAITCIGYSPLEIAASKNSKIVYLSPASSLLQEVVLSANRGEGVKRSEAPIAIATLSNKTIQDTKPTTIDQVLNKVKWGKHGKLRQ